MTTSNIALGSAETILTERAADFLAAGPADPQTLISHVCQLPGAPRGVAEHMATALFAGHQRFVRDGDGRWWLREARDPSTSLGMTGASSLGTTANVIPSERSESRNLSAMPPRTLHEEPFAVVDVETTGSRAHGGDRITEIAVVQVKDGIATTVFDSLINPERSIPPSIVAITNITWEMVKDAPRFRDVCPQLLGVLEGNVFVAHNATFDWNFVSAEVERVMRRPLLGRKLCTVRLARRLLPQLRRRNLDALAMYYGIENGARHRAGGDAEATAQILLRLLNAAADHGCSTIDQVDRLLSRGTPRKKARRRPSALPHSTRDDGTS
jgi:DNA polymerase III subunit epsilon